MQSKKISIVLVSSLLIFLTVLVANSKLLSVKNNKGAVVVKTQTLGELVAGFPEFPVYDGAKVVSSYSGSQNGKAVYGATLEITGKSMVDVWEWYGDDKLPETWVFDKKLKDISPTSLQATVSKNGWQVRITINQSVSNKQVTVDLFAIPVNK